MCSNGEGVVTRDKTDPGSSVAGDAASNISNIISLVTRTADETNPTKPAVT
jgi:hypothetical protein